MTQPRRPVLRRLAALAATSVPLLVLAAWLCGWQAHTMTTPSMGRAAPVGSLVITAPVPAHAIRVGDVIALHPPGRPQVTFTHRVIEITQHGGDVWLRTKGDINGSPDAWALTGANVIGRVKTVLPGGGYLLEALPALAVGGFLLLLLTRDLRSTYKPAARILGTTIVIGVVLLIYHPLNRITLLGESKTDGRIHVAIVPTGALPVRATVVGGSHADLTPGQPGTISVARRRPSNAFQVVATTHPKGLWWWLTTAVCATPFIVALWLRRRTKPVGPPALALE